MRALLIPLSGATKLRHVINPVQTAVLSVTHLTQLTCLRLKWKACVSSLSALNKSQRVLGTGLK